MQANLVKAVYPSVCSQQICQWGLTDLMVHMHHSCCPPQQESTDFWSNTRSQDNRLPHISLCGGTTQLYTCSRTHFHEHPKCFISSVLSSTNFIYLLQKEAYLSCSKLVVQTIHRLSLSVLLAFYFPNLLSYSAWNSGIQTLSGEMVFLFPLQQSIDSGHFQFPSLK